MKRNAFAVLLSLLLISCATTPTPTDTALKPGMIGGRVIDAQTGQPLAEYQLEVLRVDPAVAATPIPVRSTAVKDRAGRFSVSDLPAGSYQLSAKAPGYLGGSASAVVDLTKVPSPIEVRIEPGIEVEGTVTAADGSPLAGVNVSAAPTGFPSVRSDLAVTTDAAGKYRLTVPASNMTLRFVRPGYILESVPLNPNTTRQTINLKMVQATTVSGTLIDDTG